MPEQPDREIGEAEDRDHHLHPAVGWPAAVYDGDAMRAKGMKTLFAAILATGMASTSVAHAAGDSALTYGGATPCSGFVAYITNNREDTSWLNWILGYWSGLSAMDDSAAHGWIGENVPGITIYDLVVAECKNSSHQTIQDATSAVWFAANLPLWQQAPLVNLPLWQHGYRARPPSVQEGQLLDDQATATTKPRPAE
jgi:hypothetical protein